MTPSPSRTSSPLKNVGWAIAVSVAVQVFFSVYEYKLPSTDFFVFKEAGINFAQTGKFHVMNLPHMQPEESHLFSYYPPAYPFSFGLWSKAVGVGLLQSNLFDLTWRTLRTLLLAVLVLAATGLGQKVSYSRMTLLFLFGIAALSTDADRPDEMALTFALASWCAYFGSRFRILLSGVLLGMCMSASPTGGVFAGVGLFFLLLGREGLRVKTLVRLAVLAVIGASLFFSGTLPIIFADPVAYQTFSRQVPMSTFPYREPYLQGKGLLACWEMFVFYMKPWFGVTKPYVFAAAVAFLAALLAFIKVGAKGRKALGWAFYLGCTFVLLVVAVWTRQPYYLWFPVIAFAAFTLMAVAFDPKRLGAVGVLSMAVLSVALLPLVFRETKAVMNALQRPRGEAPDEIRRKVLTYVGPKERIAITPDQYFTFRNYREIASLAYMCDRLDAFEYVYVSRLISSKRDGNAPSKPNHIPCVSPLPRCFDAIADFSVNKIFTVLGEETDYYVRGSGGTLYQNRRCTSWTKNRLTQQ